jgi:hypothetical protein
MPVQRVVKAVRKTARTAARTAATAVPRPVRAIAVAAVGTTRTQTRAMRKLAAETPSASVPIATATNQRAEVSAGRATATSTRRVHAAAPKVASRKSPRRRKGRPLTGAARRKPQNPTSSVDVGEAYIHAASGCKRRRSSAPVIKEDDPVFKRSRYELNQKTPIPFKRLTDLIPPSVILGMPAKPRARASVARTGRRAAEKPPAATTVATATDEIATPETTRMVTRGQVGTVMKKRQFGEPEDVETGRSGAQGAVEHAPKRRRASRRQQSATRGGATQASPNHVERTVGPLTLVDVSRNIVDYGTGTAPLVDTSGIEKQPRSTRSRRVGDGGVAVTDMQKRSKRSNLRSAGSAGSPGPPGPLVHQ